MEDKQKGFLGKVAVTLVSSLIFLGVWVILDLPIGFGTVNFL
ncbi:MAG: hypothetical protein SPH94_01900 [Fusobacterium necrophorum]|nr:hypothetical protein [Fusobacterium necrophorum]MDY6171933.1 hypothetical protein [Fusobacterium necrophorum]